MLGHASLLPSSELVALCRYCQDMTLERTAKPWGYRHQPNIYALWQSANVCRGCHFIYYRVLSNDKPLPNRLHLQRDDQSSSSKHYIVVRRVDHEMHFDAHQRRAADSSDGIARLLTEDAVLAAAADIPWRGKLPLNTNSQASMTIASCWLQECLQHHPLLVDDLFGLPYPWSGSSEPATLAERPLRLIQLASRETPSKMRLVDAHTVNGAYGTLSYVWGMGPSPWKTLRANLDDRLRHFTAELLPPTIRDACSVLAKLGVRYLWADAVCIVQDDVEEWALEAAKMGAIYKHSTVTLAASVASDCHDGLFDALSRHAIADTDTFPLPKARTHESMGEVLLATTRGGDRNYAL